MDIVSIFVERAEAFGVPHWVYLMIVSCAIVAAFQSIRVIATVPMFACFYAFELFFVGFMWCLAWVIDKHEGNRTCRNDWRKRVASMLHRSPKVVVKKLASRLLTTALALGAAQVLMLLFK